MKLNDIFLITDLFKLNRYHKMAAGIENVDLFSIADESLSCNVLQTPEVVAVARE